MPGEMNVWEYYKVKSFAVRRVLFKGVLWYQIDVEMEDGTTVKFLSKQIDRFYEPSEMKRF